MAAVAAAEVRVWAAYGGLLVVLTGATLLVPVPEEFPRVTQTAVAAAERVEAAVPPLGLEWGPLRGWTRVGDGWELAWQPDHGMWLVRGWADDAGDMVLWRLEAAPWLPGARLSGHAAALMAQSESSWMVPMERTGRRDWSFGEAQLVGALPGGTKLPEASAVSGLPVWEAVLAGLVLAGALSRLLVPPFRVSQWRARILAALLFSAVGLPWSLPLSARFLEAGVRPWVAQAAFVATAGVLVGAVAIASLQFSPSGGAPPSVLPLLAFPLGLLLGRQASMPWVVEAAAVPARLFLWLGFLVVVSWVVGLAGEGLRELVAPEGVFRRFLLVALSLPVVMAAGSMRGLILGAVLAASVGRGQGTWIGLAIGWGWLGGLLLSAHGVFPAFWPVALFLAAGGAVSLTLHIAGVRQSQVLTL